MSIDANTTAWDNPMGTDGFEFIEYAAPDPAAMGAVFALASAATNIMTAPPEAVAAGMRITFAVAGALILVALAIASASQALSRRILQSGDLPDHSSGHSVESGSTERRPSPSPRRSGSRAFV